MFLEIPQILSISLPVNDIGFPFEIVLQVIDNVLPRCGSIQHPHDARLRRCVYPSPEILVVLTPGLKRKDRFFRREQRMPAVRVAACVQKDPAIIHKNRIVAVNAIPERIVVRKGEMLVAKPGGNADSSQQGGEKICLRMADPCFPGKYVGCFRCYDV